RFWNLCDEKLKINKSILIFLAATQLLTFWSLLMDIVDAFRDDHEKDQLLNKWAKFIRLLENICESFPQTALQSYVICITVMMGKSIASLSIFPDQFPEFPYLSVCLSLVSLCYGFVSFTFSDESGLCQVFFMLLSFLSSGIRLIICAVLGGSNQLYLWLTILSAYFTSAIICFIYIKFPLTKYKAHWFLPFTCLNTTLFNTVNTSGLCINIVFIVFFAKLHNVHQLNIFSTFLTIVWYGCGVMLGINFTSLVSLIFYRLRPNIFPEVTVYGRLWNDMLFSKDNS
ncbi:unnamed protein product, partial [Meganyctiphanes norvegica]